jgi:leader peptidase (prepilin peptidase)/N-methyltransferase
MELLDLVFGAALLAMLGMMAVIDFRSLVIPDRLNLGLAGLGLTYQALSLKAVPVLPILSAAGVFAGFWLVRAAYRHFRGVAGLGFGDVKLAGVSAVWFSPWNLPFFLFAACFSALIFVVFLSLRNGRLDRSARIPFGPFIGVGLMATWTLERWGYPILMPDGGGY